MKRVAQVVSVATAVVALCLVAGAAASPAPTQFAQYDLVFSSASDTFTFDVQKVGGAGDLSVDTIDCCVPGDLWSVTFDTQQPADSANDATGTGNGSITAFSGSATSHPFVRGSVIVSYADGTGVFPAEMCVRFQYAKAPGVEITAPAGATLNGPACPSS